MSEGPFTARLQRTWDELALLVARGRSVGARGLTAEELSRLDRLYRVTTIHLAQARSRIRNETVLRNLNHLVSQAHSLIYIAPKRHPFRMVLWFYATGFAQAVARTMPFHVVAFSLFAFGIFGGYVVTQQRPLAAYALLPALDERLPGASAEQLSEILRYGRESEDGDKFFFASFLFTHNTKVGFTAFAAGVLAGVPTVFLTVFNGAMLGAFAAVHHQKGISTEMYAWLLPHGITEILAIILCAGAGLMLGKAVVRPALETRRQALVRAGKEALNLLLGVVPMFIFAGLCESYIRQSQLDTRTRLLFAAGMAVFWILYFLQGSYQERRAHRACVVNLKFRE